MENEIGTARGNIDPTAGRSIDPTARGSIDTLALAKSERRLMEYVTRAIDATDRRTEAKHLPGFLTTELAWLQKGIDESLNSITEDTLLTIAAACLCCHARILTERGEG